MSIRHLQTLTPLPFLFDREPMRFSEITRKHCDWELAPLSSRLPILAAGVVE